MGRAESSGDPRWTFCRKRSRWVGYLTVIRTRGLGVRIGDLRGLQNRRRETAGEHWTTLEKEDHRTTGRILAQAGQADVKTGRSDLPYPT